jgi:ribonuclease J
MIRKTDSQNNSGRTRTYVSTGAPKKKTHTSTSVVGAGAPKQAPRPAKKSFGDKPRTFSSARPGNFRPRDSKPTHTSDRKPGANKVPALAPGDIRIIPLGGVEEIGRNMTMVEMNDQIIVIDAGISFADEENPGIDYLIPNTRYLEENKHKIKALVITHGHLDHIGGIPYLIDRIGNPPIYCREFGALLIKAKAADFPGLKLNIKIAEKDDGALPISPDFKIRFFGLTHSIPDSTGVILETPYGDIVSTGDVRVDNRDGIPLPKEIEQYEMFKNRNVLLMTMDSTGITSPGWSYSEAEVIDNIDKIIKEAPGRIIIATFASQMERIIEFINSAKKYGKYVTFEGRSMKTNVGIAEQLKLTTFDHVIPAEDIQNYPPHKIVIIATGGQGEEFSGLMRISNHTHKFLRLQPHDTIVLSSSVIPGNEGAVDKLKDNLYRANARVITYIDNVVHASGHGKRAELEWIHKQIKYRYFMPIHGHHHRLKMHAELAVSLGLTPENAVVPDNGSIVEIRDKGASIIMLKEKVPAEPVIIDGLSVSDSQHLVIRDRKALAQDGIFMIIVMIDVANKKVKKSPDLISRGFVYLKENQELLKKARTMIKTTTEETIAGMDPIDFDYVKDAINRKVSKFLFQSTGKRPVVIPVVLSV